jgi:hypothetical protein
MHLKALLMAGAASTSLLAGVAGTALYGHAAAAPRHASSVKPAPNHTGAPLHPGATKKGSGTATHKKVTHKAKATPTPTAKPTAKPTGQPVP